MADGMKLKVVTPTGGFYDGDVSMVELTTTEGEIGIYPVLILHNLEIKWIS